MCLCAPPGPRRWPAKRDGRLPLLGPALRGRTCALQGPHAPAHHMASVAATDGPSRSLLGGCRCVCSGALLAARSARLRCVSAPGLGATTTHRVPAQPPSVLLEMDPRYLPVLFSLLGTGGANAVHLGEAPSRHGWGCAPQAGPWAPRHRGQPAGFPCCRGMRRGGRGHKKRCPARPAVQGPMHLACWRAPCLPGRPTLRHTACRWMTRGPLGPPVSAHVMRGEHTLLRASSLLPGLAPGLGGLPPVRRAPAAVDALPRVGRLCALASPVCSAVAVGILASATPPGGCLSVRPGPTLMAGLTAPRCAPALAPASVGSHCAPALRALSYAGVCSPSLRLPPARPAAALRPAVTAGSAAALLCMVRAALLPALVRPLPLPAALEGLL